MGNNGTFFQGVFRDRGTGETDQLSSVQGLSSGRSPSTPEKGTSGNVPQPRMVGSLAPILWVFPGVHAGLHCL